MEAVRRTDPETPMTQPDGPKGHVRTIDLIGALSLAGDMALGLSAGHGVRASCIGMRIADVLGLSKDQYTDLFYAELLMDAGCTAWAVRPDVRGTVVAADTGPRRTRAPTLEVHP
jgi:hypothetical protein